MANEEKLEFLKKVLDNPRRFVANTASYPLFSKKKAVPLAPKAVTISDEMLEACKTWVKPRNIQDYKVKARSICRNHRFTDNGDRLTLALYYICAGLDDYDTKDIFESLDSDYESMNHNVSELHQRVAWLLQITSYSNNTASYHYGKNDPKFSKAFLEGSDITPDQIFVKEFDISLVQNYKGQLDAIMRQTKMELFSFEYVPVEEIV